MSMIDLIYTSGDNAHLLDLCQRANWLAGIRSDKYPSATATSIQFIDVRYTSPNFARHLELVKRFKPRYATVPDSASERFRARISGERFSKPRSWPLTVAPCSSFRSSPGRSRSCQGIRRLDIVSHHVTGAHRTRSGSLRVIRFICSAAVLTGSSPCIATSLALLSSPARMATCTSI